MRRLKGLTQKELAEKIGINQKLVSGYEIGRIKLSTEMFGLFIRALGVSADVILGLTDEEIDQEIPLKIAKRLQKIQSLPPAKQKAVLQSLDLALKGSEVSSEDTE